jgi:DNA ligase-1
VATDGLQAFARLYDAIDSTTSTNAKVAAMADFFTSAPPADAAWAVFFLTGRRLKRLLNYALIHQWTMEATGIESWLVEECYAVVGDGAETAALLLDQMSGSTDRIAGRPARSLAEWVEGRILPLRQMAPLQQQSEVTAWWRELDRLERFILLKLLTGEFRVGVSQTLVIRALAQASSLETPVVAARLMGDWTPSADWFEGVVSQEHTDDDRSRPYPFCLAAPLEQEPDTLGEVADSGTADPPR